MASFKRSPTLSRISSGIQSLPKLNRSPSIKIEEVNMKPWEVLGVQRSIFSDWAHICFELHWFWLVAYVLGKSRAELYASKCSYLTAIETLSC